MKNEAAKYYFNHALDTSHHIPEVEKCDYRIEIPLIQQNDC